MSSLSAPDFCLHHTLSAGQTFCWQFAPDTGFWQGYILQNPCRIRQQDSSLHFEGSVTKNQIRDYFSLHPAWTARLKQLPDDPHLNKARLHVHGLRCVREDWFECVCNFICSSLKQIPQIQSINRELRQRYGQALPHGGWSFPGPQALARLTETDLRQCRMGYRARHLLTTARQIDTGAFDWHQIARLNTDEASLHLQQLRGVGPKVASCILLYAAARYDAFPVDVWVQKLMHELYFPKRRQAPSLKQIDKISRLHFGPLRGIAQLFLFHWYRTSYPR